MPGPYRQPPALGRTANHCTSQRVSGSPLHKSAHPGTPFGPALGHPLDDAWGVAAPEERQQLLAGRSWTLRQHLDTAVVEIAGPARETQLEGPRTGPPSEADALNSPSYPGSDPDPIRRG